MCPSREEKEMYAQRYQLLSRPGMLRVLTIIYEHGPMPVHRIPRYGVGVGTAYRGAKEAEQLGLVKTYQCGSSICVELTERGKQIAQHLLRAVEEMLRSMDNA